MRRVLKVKEQMMRVDPEIRQSTSAQGLPSSVMKDV